LAICSARRLRGSVLGQESLYVTAIDQGCLPQLAGIDISTRLLRLIEGCERQIDPIQSSQRNPDGPSQLRPREHTLELGVAGREADLVSVRSFARDVQC